PAAGVRSLNKAKCVRVERLGALAQTRDTQVLADELPCLGVQLDEGRRFSPTTESFDADAACSGEEIQEARVLDLGSENVEKRRLDSIHDRSNVGRLRRLELASLGDARNHAHQLSPRLREVLLCAWPRAGAADAAPARVRCSARSVAST